LTPCDFPCIYAEGGSTDCLFGCSKPDCKAYRISEALIIVKREPDDPEGDRFVIAGENVWLCDEHVQTYNALTVEERERLLRSNRASNR